MNRTERREIMLKHRQRHVEELQKLGFIHKNLNSIKRVERGANRLATQWCNGEIDEKTMEQGILHFTNHVKRLFGGELPDNFFVNLDARGYALKINQSPAREIISYTDWGGYGILAPEEF